MSSDPEFYSDFYTTILTSFGDDSLRYTTLEQNMWVLDQPPPTFTDGNPSTVYISEEISAR